MIDSQFFSQWMAPRCLGGSVQESLQAHVLLHEEHHAAPLLAAGSRERYLDAGCLGAESDDVYH